MRNKRYLCLIEDGSIRLLKRRPTDNQASHMHGWMELGTTDLENSRVLRDAAHFCLHGYDRVR